MGAAGALEDVLSRALRRLHRHGGGARTVTVKVRLSDFTTVTRSVTLAQPTSDAAELREAAVAALTAADPVDPVRLLGVALSGLTHWAQLRLPRAAGHGEDAGDTRQCAEMARAADVQPDEPDEALGQSRRARPRTHPWPVDDAADASDDDWDGERLPAPLTVHTCAVGLDVEHDEHGPGLDRARRRRSRHASGSRARARHQAPERQVRGAPHAPDAGRATSADPTAKADRRAGPPRLGRRRAPARRRGDMTAAGRSDSRRATRPGSWRTPHCARGGI